jgi:hypothetical protein
MITRNLQQLAEEAGEQLAGEYGLKSLGEGKAVGQGRGCQRYNQQVKALRAFWVFLTSERPF